MKPRAATTRASLLIAAVTALFTTVSPTGSFAADVTSGPAKGPALAPISDPLQPQMRSDGTELTITPAAVAPTRLTDATPGAPVDDTGGEATVLADHVTLTGERRLEASGGVVVWYQGTRLVASRIVYDGKADRLYIEGPIHLSQPEDRGTRSEAVLVADAATLDGDLRAGMLRGARLVLARELQFAARSVEVEDKGRYTVLDHVVASACRVCAAHPTPIWEVRARRITHDRDSRQLRIEHPTFLAFGVPVLSLPMPITAPDPSVERMSGVLRPVLRTTSKLGFGVKLPWFKTLGDSADLTLTPYLAFERTLTLEARYRQAFANGALEWRGAISRDDIRKGKTRGYSFAAAEFALSDNTTLYLQQQWASDRDYLSDYGISDPDRLWSGADLEHVTRDSLVRLRAGHYGTLRDDEDQSLIPADIIDAEWTRRFRPESIGGTAWASLFAHGHRRASDLDVIGRDVARLSFSTGWQRNGILPGGVVAGVEARLDGDLWQVNQDSTARRTSTRITPTLAAEFRWPLLRAGNGATQIIEPVARIAWSPKRSDTGIPNEDSLSVELDEGNLFALDHFPGRDRRETGLRATLGVSWTRSAADGGSIGLLAGRVFRHETDPALAGTALSGRQSDWLIAANLQRPSGFAAVTRALLDNHGDLTRADMRLGVLHPNLRLSAGYAWAAAPPGGTTQQQLSFDAGWQLAEGWWAEAGSRYDLRLERPQNVSLGMTWRNECVTLVAAVKREWDHPTLGSKPRETQFDLSLRLGGFGRSPDLPGTVAQRSCMR